jgi:hypothetical protein
VLQTAHDVSVSILWHELVRLPCYTRLEPVREALRDALISFSAISSSGGDGGGGMAPQAFLLAGTGNPMRRAESMAGTGASLLSKFPGQSRLVSELIATGMATVSGEKEKNAVLRAFCHVDAGIDRLTDAELAAGGSSNPEYVSGLDEHQQEDLRESRRAAKDEFVGHGVAGAARSDYTAGACFCAPFCKEFVLSCATERPAGCGELTDQRMYTALTSFQRIDGSTQAELRCITSLSEAEWSWQGWPLREQ